MLGGVSGRPLHTSRPTGYPVAFARSASRPPPATKVLKVRTFTPKASDITRQWHVIDAEGAILGRLATEIATLLRGKHKPIWAPHVDTGDHVIIVNAALLGIDQRKREQKTYFRHSGYPGGIRSESLEHLLARNPEKVVKLAVRRMLPKGPLGRQQLKKSRVYAGPTHPHHGQQPVVRPLPDRSRARTTA
jgi:large subunit ribosomal protein L13